MNVILGQSTAMLEILQQFNLLGQGQDRDLDCVLAPVGGGGLLGGTALSLILHKIHKYKEDILKKGLTIEDLK